MTEESEPTIEKHNHFKVLLGLGIVTGLAELAYAVMNQSALPPFIDKIGMTAHLGLIYAAFLVSETVFKAPMGTVSDRIGRRPVIVIGALISASVALGIAYVKNLNVLVTLRLIDGIGAAAIWPTMVALMSGSVKAEKRTTAMSAFTISYISAIAIAPLIGGAANDITHSKRTSLFLVCAVFALTAAAAVFLTPHRSKEEEEELKTETKKISLKDLMTGIRTIPDMMLMALVAFFGIGLLIPIIKLFAMDELKMSETAFGGLVLPVAAAVGIFSLISGKVGDRWGKQLSVHLGLGLCMLAMWAISFSHKGWELAVCGMFLGTGFVLAMPAWLALVSEMAAPRLRGTVVGALGTAQGIGAVVGAYFGSQLYQHYGLDLLGMNFTSHYTPFATSAAALTVCWIMTMVFIRKGDHRRIG